MRLVGQRRPLLLIVAWVYGQTLAWAGSETASLASLSFEELSQIEVTTASRHAEPLTSAPAAVAVLTGEEVRRSGASCVPDALRWLAGTNVAQINAAEWAVGVRGFNGRYANKLLVMVDGRTVYTPLLAGVYWDVVSPVLEDLDRIEVVRGPGGALWGANAVNGVVNILTKSARDTQGTMLSGGAGTERRLELVARQGVALGDQAWLRVYGTTEQVDDSVLSDGQEAGDGTKTTQGGFRLDAEPGGTGKHLTLQGDAYRGERARRSAHASSTANVETVRPFEVEGANLLGRWTAESVAGGTLAVQGFWDHTYRDKLSVEETRDTFDLDVQQNWRPWGRHVVACGAGYRLSRDHTVDGISGGYRPEDFDFRLFNGFVQDEVMLVRERLRATLGVKLEHNSMTGYEWQPGARVLWTPGGAHSAWAGVSRAVRTPNRTEDAAYLNYQYVPAGPGRPLPMVVRAMGSPGTLSEKVVAWEAGWRFRPKAQFFADAAVFYNDYEEVVVGRVDSSKAFMEASPAPAHLVLPVYLKNTAYAHGMGGELTLSWQPVQWVRCSAFYNFLKMDAWYYDGAGDAGLESTKWSAPKHQGGLRTGVDLPGRVKVDTNVRWVGAVRAFGGVAAYCEADLRLAWEFRPGLELVVIGQNLLEPSHDELGPQTIEPRYELQRGVRVKLVSRF